MIIKLKTTIQNLRGEVIKDEEKNDITVGLILANIVLEPHDQKKGFRPLKALELARKFYNQDEIELEGAELIQIKELLENCSYQPIISAQVLEILTEAEK